MITAVLLNSLNCKLDEVTGSMEDVRSRVASWMTTIEAGDTIRFL
jgi:hypothetical protein